MSTQTPIPFEMVEDLARDFYATYCASSGGLNYQRLPCPTWPELPEATRRHWRTVARRAITLRVSRESNAETRRMPPDETVLCEHGDIDAAGQVWLRYRFDLDPPVAA